MLTKTWKQEFKQSQGGMLLIGLFSVGVLSLFSYITQNSQPRGGTAYSGLGPLTSVINQENAPQPSLMEAFSELRFLFTNDPGLCQVDKNNQHRR